MEDVSRSIDSGDILMASRKAEEEAIRRYEAAAWLREVLGDMCLPTQPTEEELRLCLRNGIVLCKAFNKIRPGSVPRIVESTSPSPPDVALSAYQYFENVWNFLVAANSLKIPTFEASDLNEGCGVTGSIPKVVDCILALKSYMDERKGGDSESWKYDESQPETPVKVLYGDESIKSSRRQWNIPDIADINERQLKFEHEGVYKASLPNSDSMKKLLDDPMLAEKHLYKSTSPDSMATQIQNMGQKFSEVLQVKRSQNFPSMEQCGSLKSLNNTPLQSLPSLVRLIISDKQPEEVPMLVEFMMRKIMEEFERRLKSRGDQVKKLKNVLKDLVIQEEWLSARAKVLEALAAGSGEELRLIAIQLQRVKMEKRKFEDEKKMKEDDIQRLLKENIKKQEEVELLKNRISQMSLEQQQWHQMEIEKEKVELDYKSKVLEMEKQIEAGQMKVDALESRITTEKNISKQRDMKYKHIISLQSQSHQEVKAASVAVKQEIVVMQDRWKEEFGSLGAELQGLAEAASGYHKVLEENRKLYNEVQDLKGNIRVFCRVRPFLSGECEDKSTVSFIGSDGDIMITNPNKQGKDSCKTFTFNKIYGGSSSQGEIFMDTQPLIRSVLDGYNVCIFAYGQTGSGKTYTMTGPDNASQYQWGVNFRALNDLFEISQSRQKTFAYEVEVQMIEIYNEQVRDLLASDGPTKRLEIKNKNNGVSVPSATMMPVNSTANVLELMAIGQRNRAVGATALNDRSSRSHSVLTVHVQGTDLTSGSILRGCLHLVDLAGSERVLKSEATGERLKEAQHINKSLSALGDVISALAQKSPHIPYRNSKLTQLLQDSLGGQAKTLMFVHISPDSGSYGETISTLKFAERVAAVELGAARKNKESAEVRELRDQVQSLKTIIAKKEAEIGRLQTMKSNRGIADVTRIMEKQNGQTQMQVHTTASMLLAQKSSKDTRAIVEDCEVGNIAQMSCSASVEIKPDSMPVSPRENILSWTKKNSVQNASPGSMCLPATAFSQCSTPRILHDLVLDQDECSTEWTELADFNTDTSLLLLDDTFETWQESGLMKSDSYDLDLINSVQRPSVPKQLSDLSIGASSNDRMLLERSEDIKNQTSGHSSKNLAVDLFASEVMNSVGVDGGSETSEGAVSQADTVASVATSDMEKVEYNQSSSKFRTRSSHQNQVPRPLGQIRKHSTTTESGHAKEKGSLRTINKVQSASDMKGTNWKSSPRSSTDLSEGSSKAGLFRPPSSTPSKRWH